MFICTSGPDPKNLFSAQNQPIWAAKTGGRANLTGRFKHRVEFYDVKVLLDPVLMAIFLKFLEPGSVTLEAEQG